ncbi:hypothetical protein ACFPT7_22930 [Acidicapsa dinghuensis]|uniref:Uncharacterized protein n=1 Tax=Acidicapsa dinghuensis TaxID=2218256 RepID=A0ABW1EME5_9BACT|nr:hypothetical protein [Acidicapsa dinghuensis]
MKLSSLSIQSKFLLAALTLWCASILLVSRVIPAPKDVTILCLFAEISLAILGTTEKNKELGRIVEAMCIGLYQAAFIYLNKLQGFLFWAMLATVFVMTWVFVRNSYKALIKLHSGAYCRPPVSSDVS